MKLKTLFKDLDVQFHGPKDTTVTGIASDSRRISKGNLFIARKGDTYDGNQFLKDAVQNGAAAILTDILDPFLGKITQVIHPDPAAIEANLAAKFYEYPSLDMEVIGVTGTSGKTTTTYLIRHILDNCGLIGGVECLIGKTRYDSTHTTPDAIAVQKMLKEMRVHGCTSAVMEVTSHALDQRRVANTRFSFAIFTNLTSEHLDYHKDMESYKKAKQKLFLMLDRDAFAIVNADDPHSEDMLKVTACEKMTFGIEKGADVMAKNIALHPQGMTFDVVYKNEKLSFSSTLIGRFNVSNILGAVAFGLKKGISLKKLKEKIASFQTVPGRLQRVPTDKKTVFVDYAHKPDALLNVLKTLREISQNKMITIFGCGGNRDRLKRPMMAKIAEEYSDIVIVTSDNPRNEEPEAIATEIVQGFQKKSYIVELDRKLAIQKALALAEKEDIVLIAGKGHEKMQVFAHKTIPFDDVQIAQSLCS